MAKPGNPNNPPNNIRLTPSSMAFFSLTRGSVNPPKNSVLRAFLRPEARRAGLRCIVVPNALTQGQDFVGAQAVVRDLRAAEQFEDARRQLAQAGSIGAG